VYEPDLGNETKSFLAITMWFHFEINHERLLSTYLSFTLNTMNDGAALALCLKIQ